MCYFSLYGVHFSVRRFWVKLLSSIKHQYLCQICLHKSKQTLREGKRGNKIRAVSSVTCLLQDSLGCKSSPGIAALKNGITPSRLLLPGNRWTQSLTLQSTLSIYFLDLCYYTYLWIKYYWGQKKKKREMQYLGQSWTDQTEFLVSAFQGTPGHYTVSTWLQFGITMISAHLSSWRTTSPSFLLNYPSVWWLEDTSRCLIWKRSTAQISYSLSKGITSGLEYTVVKLV